MNYNIKQNVTINNTLWPDDEDLFNKMDKEAASEREHEFFKIQRQKQLTNFTCANDLLMSENSNADHIYIYRVNFDEYVVGNSDNPQNEVHTMNLTDALKTNLQEAGILDKNITLLQWLRDRNYQGVEYEHNFDEI